MENNKLFELFLEERMSNALEQALVTDSCYQDTNKIIEKRMKKLGKTKPNKKQWSEIGKVLCAYNSNSSEYGRAAYRKVFQDCLILMQELYQLRESI